MINECLFEHLGMASNIFVAKSAHPETTLRDALDGLELVSSAGLQQSEQCLDDRGGNAASLKVDQRRCGGRIRHPGGTLSTVIQAMTRTTH